MDNNKLNNRWFSFDTTDCYGDKTGKRVWVRADQIVAIQKDSSEKIDNFVYLSNDSIFRLDSVDLLVDRLLDPENKPNGTDR